MQRRKTSQNPSSRKALRARETLFRLFRERPIPDEELLANLGMYMRSGALAKLLFLDEMYRKIVGLPGQIFEFGVWLGQSLVTFENLRAVHEPYNYGRRIVGFDTFEGYPRVGRHDKESDLIRKGGYRVGKGYERYLGELLAYHEDENVMSHVRKHRLVRGDASKTCSAYLKAHPEALIAMAYFDLALYEPTRRCLRTILPRLIRGSLIVFDELGHPDYPGETKAALEVLGVRKVSIQRSKILPDRAYVVMG